MKPRDSIRPNLVVANVGLTADWERLRDEWNSLLGRSAGDSIFLTHEWISTCWRHFGTGRRLFLLVVRDESETLRAIAPLQIVTCRGRFGILRCLEFIGSGSAVNPDHLDLIVERGWEAVAVPVLVDAIVERGHEWDLIRLANVSEGSVIAREFARRADEHRLRHTASIAAICPYITLPVSYERYVAEMPRTLRSELRSDRRKVDVEPRFTLIDYAARGDTDRGMDELARLHQQRSQHMGRGGNFAKSDYAAFHRELAQIVASRGWLVLRVLSFDGVGVAANYGFRYKRTWYGYQMGLDPSFRKISLGTVLIGRIIEDLIERGVDEVDMLRGRSRWKYRWASGERRDETHVFHRRCAIGWWFYLSDLLAGRPGLVAKKMLPQRWFDAAYRRFGHPDD